MFNYVAIALQSMQMRRWVLAVIWFCSICFVLYDCAQLSLKAAAMNIIESPTVMFDGPPRIQLSTTDTCITPSSHITNFADLTAHQRNIYCPSALPHFRRARNINSTCAINLCVLGETKHFSAVNSFIRGHPEISPYWLRFHVFGSMGPRAKRKYWTSHNKTAAFNEAVYDVCDGIIALPLVDESILLPGGLVEAVAYHKPIALFPEDAQKYHHHLEYVFANESLAISVADMIKYLEPGFFERQPDCQVFIDNHLVDYHYFLLESFMALYPLPETPACNHDNLRFTFQIHRSENPFQRNRGLSWKEYALTTMLEKYQDGRSVKDVIWSQSNRPPEIHYEIKASCYCIEEHVLWLRNSSNNYCVFHESCDDFETSPQAIWLSPHHKQYILPTLLPEFKHARPTNETTVNFCVIGHPKRRNYDLVAHFLKTRRPEFIYFHNLGWGPRPEAMDGFEHLFSRYDTASFLTFERMVFDLCDVVLGLLTRDITPDYFDGPKKKQSGSILQAIAYHRPMVLHEDLAGPYRAYLSEIETHSDDAESFAKAVDRTITILRQK